MQALHGVLRGLRGDNHLSRWRTAGAKDRRRNALLGHIFANHKRLFALRSDVGCAGHYLVHGRTRQQISKHFIHVYKLLTCDAVVGLSRGVTHLTRRLKLNRRAPHLADSRRARGVLRLTAGHVLRRQNLLCGLLQRRKARRAYVGCRLARRRRSARHNFRLPQRVNNFRCAAFSGFKQHIGLTTNCCAFQRVDASATGNGQGLRYHTCWVRNARNSA